MAVVVLTSLLAGSQIAAHAAALALYPNLKTLAPRDLKLDRADISPDLTGVYHNVLRFSNTTYNAGDGPLIVNAHIDPTTLSGPAVQRVMNTDGTYTDLALNNTIYWHEAHHHYHFDHWGDYQLWTKSAYDAWIASGRTLGAPSYTGDKTSSCITDEEFVGTYPASVYPGPYGLSGCDVDAQNNIHMGLSVGWGDTYDWYRQLQWIDLNQDTLSDGTYVLRSVADPLNIVYESANKSDTTRESDIDNEAVTTFSIAGGAIVDSNAPTGTVSINHVDAVTTSPTVSVDVVARDDVSGVNQFRLSNDGTHFATFNYTSSGSVPTTVAWNLADPATGGSSANGVHTVYAQAHDNSGKWGPTFTDTIDLESTGPAPPPPSTYSQAVVNDGAVGYWRLDETSGTNAADSAGSNPGLYKGGVTLGAASLLNGDGDSAASFSGSNQSVGVTSTSALSLATTVSVEAWIKPGTIPATGVFASVASKPESYSLQFNGPRMEFTIIQNGTRRRLQAASGAIVAGNVYHVVGTYDGAMQRLYINGALAASSALSGGITTNSNAFNIASWSGSAEFLTGVVDEVAVYPVALSPTQVATHYSLGSNASPPSQVQLSVSRNGTGAGTVTSAPAGVSCGATCAASFSSGTKVTLSATAQSGSVFAGWSGGGCSGTGTCAISLTANTTVTATFNAAPPVTLSVTTTGSGSGAVMSTPTGISCPATCAASFGAGSQVTLAAVAATGSAFAGWTGGGCSGTSTCTVTLNVATTVTATFNVGLSYAQTVASDAPIAYWRLGEKSGTSAADSAGTNTGTYSGGVTLGAPGLLTADPDTAAQFNGTNQMVTVPSTTALSPSAKVTLEAWIKPAALPAAGAFASVVTKAESYSLQFNGPRMEFTIMQSGIRRRLQAASGAIAVGNVYHVVGTYDGATQRLYINGGQAASAALTGAITTNTTSVRIASWAGSQEFFRGVIDEVAIFPTALAASRVLAHYNAGIAKASAVTTPATATLATGSAAIGVGGTSPMAAAFDPALHRLYVSRNNGPTNGVVVLDTETGSAVAQITTGRWAPGALAVDTTRHLVYVTAAAYGAVDDRSTVEVIDGRTNTVIQSIATAPGPKAVAVDPLTNRLYLTSASGTDGGLIVSVIDSASGVTIATVPIGTYARYYDQPFGIAIDTGANRVYATNPLDGTLHVIDGASNTEVRSVALGGAPNAVAVDQRTHVVAVAYSIDGRPGIGLVDGQTNAPTGFITLAGEVRGLAFDAANDTAYAATRRGNVATIDTRRRRLVRVTPTGTDAYGIAFDPASATVAVVDAVDATVSLHNWYSAGFS